MFEDFEFEEKYNPWDVKSLEEFYFYCCPSCPSKNANKTYFISHALDAHPQSKSVIEDLQDKTIIKTEEIEHYKKEGEQKFNPWDVKSLQEFRFYCCPECPSKFVYRTDFVKHALAIHSHSQSFIGGFEENKTDNATSSNKAINQVMKRAVVSLVKLSDKVIRKYTKRIETKDSTNQFAFPDGTKYYDRHTCKICGKSFPRRYEWQQHIKSIHEKFRYDCDKCDKSFSQRTTLYNHIKNVHENVRFNCDQCDMSFNWKQCLSEHIKIVHQNVRYNCENCDKSFSQKGHLKQHIKIVHENVRYNCDKCEKSFSQKGHLKTHIQSVHDKVRYDCDKCDKSFVYKTKLKEHIKNVHETIRFLYNCDNCDESFSSYSQLKKHAKSNHEEAFLLRDI